MPGTEASTSQRLPRRPTTRVNTPVLENLIVNTKYGLVRRRHRKNWAKPKRPKSSTIGKKTQGYLKVNTSTITMVYFSSGSVGTCVLSTERSKKWESAIKGACAWTFAYFATLNYSMYRESDFSSARRILTTIVDLATRIHAQGLSPCAQFLHIGFVEALNYLLTTRA